MVITQSISQEKILQSIDFKEYMQFCEQLASEERTTGNNISLLKIHQTRINYYRMKRIYESSPILPFTEECLQKVQYNWLWLIIVEPWSGDCAQCVPAIAKMADFQPNISTKFILRDENLDVMNMYLTDGSQSIPKLICLNADDMHYFGQWGPRPNKPQEMANKYKNQPDRHIDDFHKLINGWYAKDNTRSIQFELCTLIEKWMLADSRYAAK